MTGSWTEWLAQINRIQKLDTIVYLGVGYGADVPDLLQQTAARNIVLVDPNPVFHRTLNDAARTEPRLQVMPVALSDTAGSAPLQVFNMAVHSSLHAPAGLRDLFPGLRVEETPMVETLTLDALLEALALPPEAVHVLIMDVPAEAAMIVEALCARDDRPFAHVLIGAATGALYENVPSTKGIHQKLIPQGFRLADLRMQDPDFPKYWMRFDPVHAERAALAQRVADIGAARAELQAKHEAQHRANEALTQRIARMEADQHALRKEHTHITAQLDSSRQDVAMALRMAALQEATIEDMRRRHAELLERNAALDSLLRTVTARLMAEAEDMPAGDP